MLIEIELNSLLNGLVGKSFAINRRLDRIKSVAIVNFKLLNTANALHMLSHKYPVVFGDTIAEYQEQSNCLPIYPATPAGDENYANISECLEVYLRDLFDYRDLIEVASDKAIELQDETTRGVLTNVLLDLKDYISQSQDLMDLFLKCKSPFEEMMLDSVIESYMGE